ncbi:MAG: hypothetical protein ACJAYN_003643 [Bermanella sp.]|jgi:hypothetical protein
MAPMKANANDLVDCFCNCAQVPIMYRPHITSKRIKLLYCGAQHMLLVSMANLS